MRRARFAVACLLAPLAALSAQPAVQPVVLDLVIDGAVRGPALTVKDFEVTESGRPLSVEALRLVEPPTDRTPLQPIATDSEEEEVARHASHLVAVYIDEYHLEENEASAAARRAVADFLRNGLGPRDLVVVLKPLDSVLEIRLSSDRERAAAIVEGTSGRQGDYAARSAFEQEFLAGTPERIDVARRQIAWSGIGALASHLGRFQGRKTLIVVSNGIGGPVVAARGDRSQARLESLTPGANRAGVAVYAIRPSPSGAVPVRDIATRDADAPRDPLVALAEQTTGFTIDGTVNLPTDLRRILSELRRHYLLTIVPSEAAADGRYHAVDVRVLRPGVAFRARGGFAVGGSDPTVRLPVVRPIPPGLRVPRHTSALLRPWFGQGPSPAAAGRTRVDFVWEPAAARAGERAGQAAPAQVAMRITTMDGTEVFAGEVLPAGRDAVVAGAHASLLTFEAPPGPLLVRMQILDVARRVLDEDVRDLTVVAFDRPVNVGAPLVYRARTARDLKAVQDNQAGIAPVVSRQFSRAEHIVIRVPVSAATGQPEMTARLQSGFGAPLRALSIAPVDSARHLFQVDLPLASLASGPYAIEFSARAGEHTAADRLDFVVTP